MEISDYLMGLRNEHGISIYVHNGELKVKGGKKSLSGAIVNEIKGRKDAILNFLVEVEKQKSTVIEVVQEKDGYVLSAAQRRMYFLYEFDKSSVAYNMPQVIPLKSIDKDQLKRALTQLVERHEILRTRFERLDVDPLQKIMEPMLVEPIYYQGGSTEVAKIVKSFVHPFDLSTGPAFRVGLLEVLKDDEQQGYYLLLIDMHHIISDGVSHSVLVNDFNKLYNGEELFELKLQYKDYAEWQQGTEQQARLSEKKDFWLNEFVEDVSVLELPTDFKRPSISNHVGSSYSFSIPSSESKKLRAISKRTDSTMYMVFLSLYTILLRKLSTQQDIVVGTPVAGRDHADLNDMIGLFVNTLAIRTYVDDSLNFEQFLLQVKSKALACFENQSYPYESLIDHLNVERDASRNPLFDVMFAYQNFDEDNSAEEREVEAGSHREGTVSKFDLTMTVGEQGSQFSVNMAYAAGLFTKETIERFGSYFNKIISTIVTDQEVKLSGIELISSQERHQLLYEFNKTTSIYPKDKTLVECFAEQVVLSPQQIALSHNDDGVTYSELDARSNKLAIHLVNLGVTRRSIVGIMLDRSVDMIVAILGVLKAGGTYLPLDPSHPHARIGYMLADCQAELLLTNGQNEGEHSFSVKTVDINNLNSPNEDAKQVLPKTNWSDLCYIIYTSGSTGKPKGVEITHQSVLNLISSQCQLFGITDQDKILQFSTITFDASVEQLWLGLLNGATLVMVDKETIADPKKFNAYIINQGVTHLHATPSYLETIELTGSNNLRRIVTGGEPCGVQLARKYCENYEFYNKYGPTEATVTATVKRIRGNDFAGRNISIGQPISNTQILILGIGNTLQPIGVAGELCISGDGLARGYVNNETLTREKFVKNPYDANARMYRTGDSARWLADGTIEYLGRIDDQVKIRGFRIELGEIQSCLAQHDKIKECAIAVKGNGNDQYLVAYFVSVQDQESSELKYHLSLVLPDYMIPAYYVKLDKIPLTFNGKLDSKNLPDPELEGIDEYQGPTTQIEVNLVNIWSEILKIDADQISINSSFFQLGGHSLKVALLVNQIQKVLEVEVPISIVFQRQDIYSLALYIEKQEQVRFTSIEPAEINDGYVLSAAQRRMYFLYEFDKSSVAYNMPQVIPLNSIDKDQLKRALTQLVERHEILRTRFERLDEDPLQKVMEPMLVEPIYYQGGSTEVAKIVKSFVQPFDLSTGPAFRVGLLEVLKDDEQQGYYLLLIDMHHIISDGVSHNVLINDFNKLYNGEELPELKLQYKDYAEWQQGTEQQARLSEKKDFWLNEFVEDVSVLELPTDFKRPSISNHAGSSYSFSISSSASKKLKAISKRTDSTMYMVFLSLYTILLRRLSAQQDIVVGTPAAGRDHADLNDMIGLFVNTLAIRTYVDDSLNFEQFLLQVKSKALACFENQSYPYESLIDHLNVERDASRNPLFDVMFAYQAFDEDNSYEERQVETGNHREGTVSKFDLTMTVSEQGTEFGVNMAYAVGLFTKETIERFGNYFNKIISTIVTDQEAKLSDIELISSQEKHQLLYEFNKTTSIYPKDKTLVECFAEQVVLTPQQIALSHNDDQVTYSELDIRSHKLATQLVNLGVTHRSIVGIMLDRSIDLIVVILGVLKAAGTYLPLDPSHPHARIGYMLDDCKAELLLTNGQNEGEHSFSVKTIDINNLTWPTEGAKQVLPKTNWSDLCYIIYTSGSTGKPKGVEITHQSVLNLISSQCQLFGITDQDKILQFSTITFDASVEQLWLGLLNGATLVMVDKETIADPKKFNAYIINQGITHLHATPSYLETIELSGSNNLRRIVAGGEPCGVQLARKYCEHYEFYNKYGPTEATVTATVKRIRGNDLVSRSISIGHPISNTQILILGTGNTLQPIGVAGELCISGDGLARGYVNNETLTREKFVKNPYDSNARMYRTGDSARWLADGTIEYLGRIDDQVKVRGFRIELGEIQSCLAQHDKIKECAIAVKGNGNDQYLVAYYVSVQIQESSELKYHLSLVLPDYMIPAHYVKLDKIPLTFNGKLDSKNLPDPELEGINEYQGPSTQIEENLVKIWSEILKIDADLISINSSFFQLGGHSLKVALLVNQIRKVLEVEVPISIVFQRQDIHSLALYIEKQEQVRFTSIEPAEINDGYVLSAAQRRMYFLYEFDKSSVAYNMPQLIPLKSINKDQLKRVLTQLVERHEILRTRFERLDEDPVQKVMEPMLVEPTYYQGGSTEVAKIVKSFVKPFDLSTGPVFRVGLLEVLKDDEQQGYYLLLIDMHHIISDGVSHSVLVNDFNKLYNGEELPELKLQYKDYAEWQQGIEQQARLSEKKDFWLNEFVGDVSVLELPTDFRRPSISNHAGSSYSFSISSPESKKLRAISKRTDSTMYMVFLSLYTILLRKLSTQQDIIVGTPVAGRDHADLNDMIGLFVNTLAIRTYVDDSLNFEQFLLQVKSKALACFENQSYPYESLIDHLNVERDASRNPLFDVMFAYQAFDEDNSDEERQVETGNHREGTVSKFDLTMTVSEQGTEFSVNMAYAVGLFTKETIERFGNYFNKIISTIVTDQEAKLSDIELISSQEKHQLLYEFNKTTSIYPKDKTLVECFAEQVVLTPQQIALSHNDDQVTYSELDARSYELADQLVSMGIIHGSIVGIMLDRSIDLIVAILGVLKAGGTYLPLDPNHPHARIAYMLADCQAELLLTNKQNEGEHNFSVKTVDINNLTSSNEGAKQVLPKTDWSDLCYIIYTSGSTGKPKGVEITHQSVLNLISSQCQLFGITDQDKILQFSTITFDASVEQLWLGLLNGATLVMVDKETIADPTKFNDYIINQGITHLHATPSYLETIELSGLNNLRRIIAGGERCSAELASKYSEKYEFYNEYGPTEATVTATVKRIWGNDLNSRNISIGQPISNTQILILGSSNTLQPIGVAGELCISGDGLARGYVNNETLTRERFVKNPYENNARMYRTGDSARWLADGAIEYLGRIDDQVKIRGFRIELGEIQSCLAQHDKIKECAIVVKGNGNDQYLVAYYVSVQDQESSELKYHLSLVLPDYMIPAYYVKLDKIPLTFNGKLDSKNLPDPKLELIDDYQGPSTEIEENLVKIWSDILKIDADQISVNSSFFQLGGHSLKVALLVNQIRKVLEVEVPISMVFQRQDIYSLAQHIEKQEQVEFTSIAKAEIKESYVLSAAQRRMYFLYEFDKSSMAYNMPQVIPLKSIDKNQLQNALTQLVQRHEILRTRFEELEDGPVQKIEDAAVVIPTFYKEDASQVSKIVQSFIQPFNLNTGPMLRVGLVEVRNNNEVENHFLLLIDMHHIISDGISHAILINDFNKFYEGNLLPELNLQYKDYAEWQQGIGQQTRILRQKNFWLQEFQDEVISLQIPTDFPRPMVRNYKGDAFSFRLSVDHTTKLKDLAADNGATMYMMILSIFNVFLSKLGNQDDVVIGTVVAGREHADLEDMIGMFVNTLPVRNKVDDQFTFEQFLSAVKSKVLTCFENQAYPYESLVEELDIQRNTGRNPLFDIVFSYQTKEGNTGDVENNDLPHYGSVHKVSKFDMSLSANDIGEQINFSIGYATSLFTRQTIERFAGYFNTIIEFITYNEKVKLCDIELISDAEQQRLVSEFNDTLHSYPKDKTVIELFQKQVLMHPKSKAIIDGKRWMTYGELDKRSNQIAKKIKSKISNGEKIKIGILLNSSIEMIVGLLAVLKSGSAYVPILSNSSTQRKKFILEDSGAELLLTESSSLQDEAKLLKYFNKNRVVTVDEVDLSRSVSTWEDSKLTQEDLIYVIYTSGTTGNPKGVEINHLGITNMVHAYQHLFKVEPGEQMSQVSNISFDASVFEIWPCLSFGGCLNLAPEAVRFDPEKMKTWLVENQINITFQPPVIAEQLLKYNWGHSRRTPRIMNIAGDRLNYIPKKELPFKIFNLYGPTEDSVWSTYAEVVPSINDTVYSIGRPIFNKQILIINSQNKIQPIGVPGELCISGDGLARGYLNNDTLTNQKFVNHPFTPNTRMYRTGDLASWHADGNIGYLGRIDSQVKIRGFRIEMGEIEYRLGTFVEIKEVVVIARQDEDEPYLVAYYTGLDSVESRLLRDHLLIHLPEYMIPTYFVYLDFIPLTTSGKINKRALPAPDLEVIENYCGPETLLESQLVTIWSSILKIDAEGISVTRSFFEMGGHSLKAAIMANQIFKHLKVELPIRIIFEKQDIRSLSQYIERQVQIKYLPIENASAKDHYVLSAAQSRMYFLYEFDKISTAYNITQSVKLKDKIDKKRLEKTLWELVARHEVLRTRFEVIDDQPVQIICESTNIDPTYFQANEKDTTEVIRSFVRPFDLNTGPLIRVGLIDVIEDNKGVMYQILIVDMHHIISDGVSNKILIEDFNALYEGLRLKELKLQYKDYAEWQQKEAQQVKISEQGKFWLSEFEDNIQIMELPTDFKRPFVADHLGQRFGVRLPEPQIEKLRSIAKKEGTSMYMVFLSLYAVLLSKLSNQLEVIIGTPVAGRDHADLDGMIGLFVNTLAIKNVIDDNWDFQQFLSATKLKVLSCFENQSYPYEDLVDKLGISRDMSRNPLFDVMFSYQKLEADQNKDPNTENSDNNKGHAVAKFDLNLSVSELGEQVYLDFVYATSLFNNDSIERFATYFQRIISQVIKNPTLKLSDLELISEKEKHQLIHEFNNTSIEYDKDATIVDAFDKHVIASADHIALAFNSEKVTYAQLHQRSNHFAQQLMNKGVGRGCVVAIMLDRSIDMIVAILGILKAGGTYLPLDATQPNSRNVYILNDCQAQLLVTNTQGLTEYKSHIPVSNVDDNVPHLKSDEIHVATIKPRDICYIIYTSGSSGQPKGVKVTHRSVMNLINSQRELFDAGKDDRILQFSSITFDASVEQIWLALLTGATLVLVNKDTMSGSTEFSRYLIDQRITHLHATPSYLETVELVQPNNLKRVIAGGEICSLSVVRKFCKDYQFYNEYGPTETTVTTTVKRLLIEDTKRQNTSIGRPIANTQVFILGRGNTLQPVGIPGELCVSGEALALGYVNNPDLTKEKFVNNPFCPGELMYRTGDHARWLSNGEIEFLGRMDDQVKVRGFRIELGEIEYHLTNQAEIIEAKVLVRSIQGENTLVAYYKATQVFDKSTLRSYLSDKLPEYMIPDYYVHLEKFPVTTSGKLQKKALPDPQLETGDLYTAPSNNIEDDLVLIWSEVLHLEKKSISVSTSFFEIGGHSLRATIMVNKILKNLNVVVPLKVVFQHQDIRSLGNYILSQTRTEYQSIPVAPKKNHYVLSSAQKRMYFLYEFDKSSTAYNMPQVIPLHGEINRKRLTNALSGLIKRHAILRTVIEVVDSEPFQRILDFDSIDLQYHECSRRDMATILKSFVQAFDLREGPLFRVGLIELLNDSPKKSSNWMLMLDMHHIVSDGASHSVLIKDFDALYQNKQLPELSLQYHDYSEWQQSDLQRSYISRQKEFWLTDFEEEVTALDLPTDFPRPLVQDHNGSSIGFTLPSKHVKRLQDLAKQEGSTMYMVFLSIYTILLSKLSNQQDIVVGTPVAGRVHADVEDMVGLFVNTLAIRNYVDTHSTFLDYLDQVKTKAISCFENQSYPYEELVDQLGLHRNTERNPLFDVMFAYQSDSGSNHGQPHKTVPLLLKDNEHTISKFDLTLSGIESGDYLQWNIEYSTALFTKATIKRLITYFSQLVSNIVEDPNGCLSTFGILSKKEKHQLLHAFNNVRLDYPKERTITALFEEQVERSSNHLAIEFGDERLTYQELNLRANQTANFLVSNGVKQGDVVAIMLDRSIDMIVGILAVLKAGGIYLPIDIEQPEHRKHYILQDSNAVLLIRKKLKGDQARDYIKSINLDEPKIKSLSIKNLSSPLVELQLAYIIYTSGSTGNPKGVMVRHHTVVNLIFSQIKNYELSNRENILQFSNISFDASVEQILLALLTGSKLVLISKDTLMSPTLFNNYIQDKKITHLDVTPTFLAGIGLTSIGGLNRIVVGGEKCSPDLVVQYGKHCDFFNVYGPTEATVTSLVYKYVQSDEGRMAIPIGKPIHNVAAYVLDKDQNIQPIGVSGELCISGECLSEGYLNNEELTWEKFVEHPYIPEEKLYKTGDVVRRLKDGNIEFLDRIDDQVKIRGFRVELGEIEYQLISHDEIKEVVLLPIDSAGDKSLVAYYSANRSLEAKEFREYLVDKVPDYMIPSYYVHLDELPMTTSGKVNKKALPRPELEIRTNIALPSGKVEEQLANIWSVVLKLDVDTIDVTRSFFELGGHSLRAAVMVNKVSKELAVEVPLREVFTHQDIRNLAIYITGLEHSEYRAIPPASNKEYYVLSAAQKRMYFLHQFNKNSLAYNMPQVVSVEGGLNTKMLERAFEQLIARHESLRTSFIIIEDEPVQKISEQINFVVEYFEADFEQTSSIIEKFIRPFDLGQGPLLRVGVLREPNTHNVSIEKIILMVDLHHIISDGVSQGILVEEFLSLYYKDSLPEISVQYKDYAEWQQGAEQQEALLRQREFWIQEFDQPTISLDLLTDFKRPLVKGFSGGSVNLVIGSKETTQLKAMANTTRGTMFMVILSAFNILLSKLSNQLDIVVGTPSAGRQHTDLDRMIGMFVNTIPLRNYPNGDLSFQEFLSQVQSKTLLAFENQDYQYEALIDELRVNRDTSRNPLFDVMFSYQNIEKSDLDIQELTLKPYRTGNAVAKFDLTLSVTESEEELYLNFGYATELYKRETIERFTRYFKSIISQITKDPEVRLASIDILSQKERDVLLHEFNDTLVANSTDETIIRLFQDQVQKTPNKIAVVHDGIEITYKQLNSKANQMAHVLRENGVQQSEIVCLMVEKSIEMVVGLLAILKAGGAFLSIDPNYPKERTQFILDDSKSRVVISRSNLVKRTDFDGVFIDVSGINENVSGDLDLISVPDDLAYIIYTSGSTGTPKGVMIEQKSLVNLSNWHNQHFKVQSSDKASQYASQSFDASVWEIFPYLIKGACIHIIPDEIRLDVNKLNDYFESNGITMSFLPTQVFEQFMEVDNSSLRILLTGGDQLRVTRNTSYQIFNNYGPTENSVVTTCFEIRQEDEDILIGKPVSNTELFVLNEYLELVPIGATGELCIGGIGLARGYLNLELQTTDSFVQNPFRSGEKMYRTGDLVRWRSDSNMEFLGRRDNQVKIRGFRIELGEIEHQLATNEQVKEVVVLANERHGDKSLVAYYMSDKEVLTSELRDYLSDKLPEYMIPAYFMKVEAFPITSNGKIDEMALPFPDIDKGTDYVAPTTVLEERLVGIWSELLKIEREHISTNKSFFELGGHSLKAVSLISRIKKELVVEIPLVELFARPTIQLLSTLIERLELSPVAASDIDMVLLKQNKPSADNVFFIHDGSGDIHAYTQLVNLLDDYQCWGVRSPLLRQVSPENLTLEVVATDYIAKIKEIQPVGPYRLAGWSLGGTLGFEIVKQLEAQQDVVEQIVMIDSMFNSSRTPVNNELDNEFSLEMEISLLSDLIGSRLNGGSRVDSVEALWELAVVIFNQEGKSTDELKNMLPKSVVESIPKIPKMSIKRLITYVNTIRSYSHAAIEYKTKGSVNAQLVHIKANTSKFDSQSWSPYFKNEIVCFEVPGDHFTILDDPTVQQLVKAFQSTQEWV